MKAVVIIPARYGSTRLPGKVLLKKTGKYLVQHTYEQALKATEPSKVIIATDDRRVFLAAESFGATVIMTKKTHRSGTDRVAEVAQKLSYPIVVNLQADEPEIDPKYIDLAIKLARLKGVDMATLACPVKIKEELTDPNKVRVIIDKNGFAVDFSRQTLPTKFRHIGLYAYKKAALLHFTKLKQTLREKQEKLEQLRALENGFRIKVGIVKSIPLSIDTPKDYEEFVARLSKA